MARIKSSIESPLVPMPSGAYIPERDLDKLPVLEARHLGIDFGGLTAVDDFNLVIGRTEIAGLIGPNGAGKTTVFNLLTKVYQPTRGTIMVDGKDTAGMSTVQVSKLGVARTFQNIRLFSNLSVEDNVKLGMHNQIKYGMFRGILRLPSYWKQERIAHERAMELLSIFDMQDMDEKKAGSLPYGAQRRLEIVRALGTNPNLLLLDEPAAGLDLGGRESLVRTLGRLAKDPATPVTVLVTHHVEEIPPGYTHVALLREGGVVAAGPIAETLTSQNLTRTFGLPLIAEQRGERFTARSLSLS